MVKIFLGILFLSIYSWAGIFYSCAGCHGFDAGKKALGKSRVIKGWSVVKIEHALNGYKNRTYGSYSKKIMYGQVKRLSSKDIKELALMISNFK